MSAGPLRIFQGSDEGPVPAFTHHWVGDRVHGWTYCACGPHGTANHPPAPEAPVSGDAMDEYVDYGLMSREDGGIVEGFLRRPTRPHRCALPQSADPGDVWRCHCGRRYTCIDAFTHEGGMILNRADWRRRYWPWPR